jgi:peptide/nickel transport system ATP-binding protein
VSVVPVGTDDTLAELRSVSLVTRGPGGRRLLDDISVAVRRGQSLGVVGASGSGKSLLAAVLLGSVPDDLEQSGEVIVDRREVSDADDRVWRRLRGSKVALVPSDARRQLVPTVAVGEQIIRAIRSKRDLSRKVAAAMALDWLNAVGVADPRRRMSALPVELSGGMCQRIVIALAMCNEPELVIADEPGNGLDVTIQRQILRTLAAAQKDRGLGMVILTRDLGIVAHFCGDVAVLDEGRLVESASVKAFFRAPQASASKRLLDAAFASRGQARGGGPASSANGQTSPEAPV